MKGYTVSMRKTRTMENTMMKAIVVLRKTAKMRQIAKKRKPTRKGAPQSMITSKLLRLRMKMATSAMFAYLIHRL